MLDHVFKSIPYWRIGPLRNHRGYTFTVAEIGDIWFLRWQDPRGQEHVARFTDHDLVVAAIESLNQGRPII